MSTKGADRAASKDCFRLTPSRLSLLKKTSNLHIMTERLDSDTLDTSFSPVTGVRL